MGGYESIDHPDEISPGGTHCLICTAEDGFRRLSLNNGRPIGGSEPVRSSTYSKLFQISSEEISNTRMNVYNVRTGEFCGNTKSRDFYSDAVFLQPSGRLVTAIDGGRRGGSGGDQDLPNHVLSVWKKVEHSVVADDEAKRTEEGEREEEEEDGERQNETPASPTLSPSSFVFQTHLNRATPGEENEDSAEYLFQQYRREEEERRRRRERGRGKDEDEEKEESFFDLLDADCTIQPNVVMALSNDSSYPTMVQAWDISQEMCFREIRFQSYGDLVGKMCHWSERELFFVGYSSSGSCAYGGVVPTSTSIDAFDHRCDEVVAHFGYNGICKALCVRQAKSQLIVPNTKGIIHISDLRMLGDEEGRSPHVIKKWKSRHSPGGVNGCCDVEDRDMFVTTGGWNRDRHVRAWNENGRCKWAWRCPSNGLRQVFPFVDGF